MPGLTFRFFASAVAVVSLLLSQQAISQDAPQKVSIELKSIRSELISRTDSRELPSVSVGVVRNGVDVWRESFGFASIEQNITATPDTVYAVGSLSKSMTGTAVFKLVEEGKIDLRSPIAKYLRSIRLRTFVQPKNDYKVLHLLNMAAGVPHYWRYCYVDSGELDRCAKANLKAASFSAFEPGSYHLYSNLSFGLAAQMIADVSGKPFSRFIRESIFRPSGMNRTFTHRDEIPKAVVIARPYKRDGKPAPDFQFEPAGGGGFYSSVNDLLRYGLIHLGESGSGDPVLQRRTLDMNHTVNRGLPHRYYANGWGVLPLGEFGISLLSNGAIEGAAATLLVLPKEKVVVVVLVNKTVGNDVTDDLAFRIAGAILPGYKERLDGLFAELGPEFADKEFLGMSTLEGDWKGSVHFGKKRLPVDFRIRGSEIFIKFDRAEFVKVEKLRITNSTISGTVTAPLLGKSEHGMAIADLIIRLERDRLTGFVSFETLKPRPELLLAYYLSAKRAER
ncbi:MAG: beta-lactamase family protein [Acidobacteria bacterium]|nr:beta-lactamase family protein [Acidobacteriota bacterium]